MRITDVNFSLPGAIGSYGLALGILQIHGKLPSSALALITGLNAATVGIIAHAAVYLSRKAITDALTRVLLILSAAAGLLYSALWYFPVLMVASGAATLLWDSRLNQRILKKLSEKRGLKIVDLEARTTPINSSEITSETSQKSDGREEKQKRDQDALRHENPLHRASEKDCRNSQIVQNEYEKCIGHEKMKFDALSWKCGLIIMIGFFLTFIIIMILRAVLRSCPRGLSLLANLYLAGDCRLAAFDVKY